MKMSSTTARSISCVDNAVVTIVRDEVEMVMRAKIRQVLKFFYVELCQREMIKQLMKDCEGCVLILRMGGLGSQLTKHEH